MTYLLYLLMRWGQFTFRNFHQNSFDALFDVVVEENVVFDEKTVVLKITINKLGYFVISNQHS